MESCNKVLSSSSTLSEFSVAVLPIVMMAGKDETIFEFKASGLEVCGEVFCGEDDVNEIGLTKALEAPGEELKRELKSG